jgi:hypothetical protein
MCHHPSTLMFSPTQKLSKPCRLGRVRSFIEVSLHRHDWLNHWPLGLNEYPAPLPLLSLGKGWKSQHSNHMVGFSCSQPPFWDYLGCQQDSVISISWDMIDTKMLYHPYNSRNAKSFRSFESGTRDKEKMCSCWDILIPNKFHLLWLPCLLSITCLAHLSAGHTTKDLREYLLTRNSKRLYYTASWILKFMLHFFKYL